MTSVQAVVNASMVYLSNRSDVNQVQLQRQLDVRMAFQLSFNLNYVNGFHGYICEVLNRIC